MYQPPINRESERLDLGRIQKWFTKSQNKKAVANLCYGHILQSPSIWVKKYSLSDVGIFLFSHLVAKALSSALQGLTSVFGMETGGPPASSITNVDSEYSFCLPNRTQTRDIIFP